MALVGAGGALCLFFIFLLLILAWLCWRGWTRRRMSRAQAVSIAALLVALCLDLYYFSSLLVFGTGSARTVLGNSTDLHSNATAPAATLPVQKSLSLLLVLLFLTILLHVLAVVCVFMVRRLLCALLLCIIVTLLATLTSGYFMFLAIPIWLYVLLVLLYSGVASYGMWMVLVDDAKQCAVGAMLMTLWTLFLLVFFFLCDTYGFMTWVYLYMLAFLALFSWLLLAWYFFVRRPRVFTFCALFLLLYLCAGGLLLFLAIYFLLPRCALWWTVIFFLWICIALVVWLCRGVLSSAEPGELPWALRAIMCEESDGSPAAPRAPQREHVNHLEVEGPLPPVLTPPHDPLDYNPPPEDPFDDTPPPSPNVLFAPPVYAMYQAFLNNSYLPPPPYEEHPPPYIPHTGGLLGCAGCEGRRAAAEHSPVQESGEQSPSRSASPVENSGVFP